ncbi:hypothetical protein D3C71_1685220 [compost metagenome]
MGNLSSYKRFIKSIEFLFSHRTVKISCFSLVITGSKIYLAHIDGLFFYNRRSGVIEVEIVFTSQLLYLLR